MTGAFDWQHWMELPLVIGTAAAAYTLVVVCWARWRGRETKDVVGSIVVATAVAGCAVWGVKAVVGGW
ncbi:MAG: hypothetical protein F4Y60_02055 [Boseongicola sp. SB0664_bin_43]|uniref:Uncharacterized protein n=1 Tax=Boseongicola sp. SB0664_bin_43 TaxID=2604844 RepID=A0A6B0Y1H6_9RHOB|nr:hypothetical protein [Boseongicola sp. SB0664_bin_43]MYK31988.1 hypothetical protein [Boseongicola sp. SB0670_bin_30]